MTQPLICHLLIGLPASGKSTFAQLLAGKINGVVVSTDKIRAELYEDETTQGIWTEIEQEVCRQIGEAVVKKQPVFYDATNAKRLWRMPFLQEQANLENVQWIGWYLKTDTQVKNHIKICQERNQKRTRQVPEEIIDEMGNALRNFPPEEAEGFAAVYPVLSKDNKFYLEKYQKIASSKKNQKVYLEAFPDEIYKRINDLDNSQKNRQNSTNNEKTKLHKYSRLLDFERLMYLISVIIKYPGIGNLAETEPKTLKKILDLEELPKFSNSIEEICAVITKKYHSIYADAEAIEKNLNWLEKNGLFCEGDVKADLVEMDVIKDPYLVAHRYSNRDQFERLIKTIRFIIHNPFVNNPIKNTQISFVEAMFETGLFKREQYNLDKLQKDIQLCLNPYQLLPKVSMKKGYFAGTAIFSQSELNKIFQLLQSQSQEKYFQDPVAGDIYDTFQKRMIDSRLLEGDEPYPVRVIGTKSIVNVDKHRQKFELLEKTIKNGELLEIKYIPGSATWTEEKPSTFRAYPLQIVFHNIAWYLGYQIEGGKNNGLFKFERIDRITFQNTRQKQDIKQQRKSLENLSKLYTASAGIFLRDDVKEQQEFLKNAESRKPLETKIVLYTTNNSFRFICEGNQRFNKIKMSKPDWFDGLSFDKSIFCFEANKNEFPYNYKLEIIVPKWSLEDIDLIRWIAGWGREIKVIEPQDLIKTIKEIGEGIEKLYCHLNLIICEVKEVEELINKKQVDAFISIMNQEGNDTEIKLVESKKQTNSDRVLQLKLDGETTINEEIIKQTIDFAQRIYKKFSRRKNANILIYCHSGISRANEIAIALYTALTQDPELAALRISLSYLTVV